MSSVSGLPSALGGTDSWMIRRIRRRPAAPATVASIWPMIRSRLTSRAGRAGRVLPVPAFAGLLRSFPRRNPRALRRLQVLLPRLPPVSMRLSSWISLLRVRSSPIYPLLLLSPGGLGPWCLRLRPGPACPRFRSVPCLPRAPVPAQPVLVRAVVLCWRRPASRRLRHAVSPTPGLPAMPRCLIGVRGPSAAPRSPTT